MAKQQDMLAAAKRGGGALAEGVGGKTLIAHIESEAFRDQLIAAHPRIMYMDNDDQLRAVKRFIALARTEIKRNVALEKSDHVAVLNAILDASRMGLEPGPHKHVYLVPFRDRVSLIVDSRGWAELGRRAGFKSPQAGPIYENDEVSFCFGQDKHFSHSWDVRKPRGKIVAYYAYVETQDGEPYFEIIDLETIERHKKASPSGNSGPWAQWPIEMANKTAIKILYRLLPLTEELDEAMTRDESVSSSKFIGDTESSTNIIDVEPSETPQDEPEAPTQDDTPKQVEAPKAEPKQKPTPKAKPKPTPKPKTEDPINVESENADDEEPTLQFDEEVDERTLWFDDVGFDQNQRMVYTTLYDAGYDTADIRDWLDSAGALDDQGILDADMACVLTDKGAEGIVKDFQAWATKQ